MYIDKRNADGGQRVSQGDTGMGVGRGIDDDEIGLVLAGSLNPINELTFVITLKCGQRGTIFSSKLRQMLIDIGPCLPSVHLWLARAEQIQIGAVQNEDVLRHCECFVKTDRLFTLNSRI